MGECCMLRRALFVFCSACLAFASSLPAAWYGEGDFTTCPRQYIPKEHGESEPFNTRSECEEEIAKVQSQTTMACAVYTCVEKGGDSGSSGASGNSTTDLQDASSRAIADGIVNGHADNLGLGLMGLALGSALSGPSPEQVAAQRRAEQQAELNRQRQAREAQAAYEKQQRDYKEENWRDIKGMKGMATGEMEPLSPEEQSELKDGGNKGTPTPTPRPKKPVPIIKLQARPNPLEKAGLPEDVVDGTEFASFRAANQACPNCSTATNVRTGMVASCPPGFPYYCNDHCYSEAALNDFRIPCSSKLRTSIQGDELK